MTTRLSLVVLLVFACVGRAAEPQFRIDVMATLSKAGCNAGTCHGNQNGKGGFKLSLRGQDPAKDYARLTREATGRRIDRITPALSLILTKPSGQTPHGGGVRLPRASREYEVLRRWIAAGAKGPDLKTPQLTALSVTPQEKVVWAPQRTLALQVNATFSNGETRDVSADAVYEPADLKVEIDAKGRVLNRAYGESTIIVRYLDKQQPVTLAFLPRRDNFVWTPLPQHNVIDRAVDEKLKRLQTLPSSVCSDGVFIRRVYLDALGFPPSGNEAEKFVADTDPKKRVKLIDRVLARPEFSDNWALKWADILRLEEKVLDKKGVAAFHGWVRESIQSGKPIDQFVRELVTGRGSTYKSPPANFYRANRKPTVRGETTARLFLGVRLQCAQCHNHPFDVWTQDDYFDWASVFARVDYKIVENKRRDKFDKNEFNGEQIVLIKDKGEIRNAATGADAKPRFLGGPSAKTKGPDDRLTQLADWLTSKDNQLFVRSQANWIWYQLMGRGIVEPVDDFRLTNPPSNPRLLDALAEELTTNNFDLRGLVRLIMNSRTYQASSTPNETNEYDIRNFARNQVRRLTAEQLLDAQSQVLGEASTFNGYSKGTRAAQLQGVNRFRPRDKSPASGDRFLLTFGKPQRLLSCECERSNETSLNQALELIAGGALHDRLESKTNELSRLAKNNKRTNREVVSQLYWRALCRPPNDAELDACLQTVDEAGNRLEGLRDVAWALLNAKAFIYRE